ncbi:hypothetical protein H5410_050050, partial [Solanum commersonii]
FNEVIKTEEEYYSSGAARVFHLESLLPANHITRIDELVARDRARHARILLTITSGVINFPLNNSFDLNLVGYLSYLLPSNMCHMCIFYAFYTLYHILIESKSEITIKRIQIVKLNFYDIGNSTTATVISYSTPVCKCTRTKQCGYTLNYVDESRTTAYFLSDILHLDTILRTSLIASSSAPIIYFG